MTAVPIAQASRELGISRSQVLRDIEAGAPVARRGSRGRGRQTLIDPLAFTAWRRSRSVAGDADALRALAGELPELLADAMHEAFVLVTGPHKRAVAGALAGAWYLAATRVLDHMRGTAGGICEVSAVPEKITGLRVIFADSGSLPSSSTPEAR